MHISSGEYRRAFTSWLRTGRWPEPNEEDKVEAKYNRWHDPDNGRFTFANGGRHDGAPAVGAYRSGGGFGGGGASGGWSASGARSSRVAIRRKPATSAAAKSPMNLATSALPRRPPSARTESNTSAENTPTFRTVARNGHEFQIDDRQRTRRVSGIITLSKAPVRSRNAQRQAGGADRRRSDDGGHYIAARFNGPGDAFNHFAQNANFNRGEYRVLEDTWARSTKRGEKVRVQFTPFYSGKSVRPTSVQVFWKTGDSVKIQLFTNEPRETRRVTF